MKYTGVISHLPSPTETQMHQFAEYVSGAHSWYKHLPLYPSTTFTFFLDPNAGREMIRMEDGGVEFKDITEERDRFHYSMKTTAFYRDCFGYWNYDCGRGTSFQDSTREGVRDTSTVVNSRIIEPRTVVGSLLRILRGFISPIYSVRHRIKSGPTILAPEENWL